MVVEDPSGMTPGIGRSAVNASTEGWPICYTHGMTCPGSSLAIMEAEYHQDVVVEAPGWLF